MKTIGTIYYISQIIASAFFVIGMAFFALRGFFNGQALIATVGFGLMSIVALFFFLRPGINEYRAHRAKYQTIDR